MSIFAGLLILKMMGRLCNCIDYDMDPRFNGQHVSLHGMFTMIVKRQKPLEFGAR